MAANFCDTCRDIFRGPQRLKEVQPHHQTLHALFVAAESCYICRHVRRAFTEDYASNTKDRSINLEAYLGPVKDFPESWLKLTIEVPMSSQEGLEGDEASDNGADTAVETRAGEASSTAGSDLSDLSVRDTDRDAWDMWGFIVQPAEEVRANVGSWSVPAELHNDTLVDLISTWNGQCVSQHAGCLSLMSQASDFKPTRLLDLSSLPKGKIRLIATSDSQHLGAYATVSHCWGKVKTLRLLASNFDAFKKEIAVSELQAGHREAIFLADRLGIIHIWIDSLCIVQDSREDWTREAGMMGNVYRHSYLNIALAGGEDSSEPSFANRIPTDIRPAYIEAEWDHGAREGCYVVAENVLRDRKASKLQSRAWVLQETLLAPRILTLGKAQVWFECRGGLACETYPGWTPSTWYWRSRLVESNLTHGSWESVVETYSGCDLTVLSDRMVALSGIASLFEDRLSDRYVAGLWQSQIPAELLWRTARHDHKKHNHRPTEYRAPSWSWASIEGEVEFMHRFTLGAASTDLCQVERLEVELVDPSNPHGLLKDGYIDLRGYIRPVVLLVAILAGYENDWPNCIAVWNPESAHSMSWIKSGKPSYAVGEFVGEEAMGATWWGDVDHEEVYVHRGDEESLNPFLEEISQEQFGSRFCLPVISYEQDGLPRCQGLVLEKLEGRRETFRRVAFFETIGSEACACFITGEQSLVRIV